MINIIKIKPGPVLPSQERGLWLLLLWFCYMLGSSFCLSICQASHKPPADQEMTALLPDLKWPQRCKLLGGQQKYMLYFSHFFLFFRNSVSYLSRFTYVNRSFYRCLVCTLLCRRRYKIQENWHIDAHTHGLLEHTGLSLQSKIYSKYASPMILFFIVL